MKINDIILNAKKHWIAPNGLMRLDPDDTYNETDVKNANGIYFLGHFLLLLKKLGREHAFDPKDIDATVRRLEEKPGLLNRHPGGNQEREAQDNYVGAQLCKAIYREDDLAKRINKYGFWHLYNYNNVPPHKMQLNTQRQGGEVAFYRMMAGKYPILLMLLWLIGGVLINAFSKPQGPRNHVSDSLLTYARLECILCKKPKSILFKSLKKFWLKKAREKYGSIANLYKAYYQHTDHPIRKLLEFLTKELE